MKNWLKYILLILAAGICLVYAVYANKKGAEIDRQKICNGINISIAGDDKNKLVSNQEIAQLLKSKDLNPIGKSMEEIRTEDLERVLERHPMVRSVECFKSPNGTIQIEIEQRVPVLRVSGIENYYVDDMKKVLPVSLNFAAYVPIVTGRITQKMATGDLYNFTQYIGRDSFWNNQIEQIHINDHLEAELVPRVGNHIILLGTFDRYEQKLDKLKKFYLYGLNKIGWNAYSTIDLRFKNQVVCKKK